MSVEFDVDLVVFVIFQTTPNSTCLVSTTLLKNGGILSKLYYMDVFHMIIVGNFSIDLPVTIVTFQTRSRST